MNALVRKEIRLIRPAWISAVLLALAPGASFAFGYGPGFGFAASALGAILLGLASFGQEFGSGTFSLLLAQPVPRRRIWRVKVAVLATALAVVAAVGWLSSWPLALRGTFGKEFILESGVFCGLAAGVAFAGGLWTILLFRQVAAAFWFALLVPALIFVVDVKLLEDYPDRVRDLGLIVAFGTYSVVGFLWARRLFLRAQDVQWTGGVVSLPAWCGSGIPAQPAARAVKRKPLRALIRKEFQSHQVSFLIAGAMLMLHLAIFAFRKVEYDPTRPNAILQQVLASWWLLWLALPPLIGSGAIAEERKSGTLEGLLCLPVRPSLTLALKLGVALVLGVLLGGVMPWAVECTGAWIGIQNSFFPQFFSWGPLAAVCAVAAGLTLVSFYASSFSRNTLQGIGAAIVVGLALGAVCLCALRAASPFRADAFRYPLWSWPLLLVIGLPSLLAVLARLTCRNYRSLQAGWSLWLRNLLAILIWLTFVSATTALTYNRAWESLLSREPHHGPARLSGSVRPKLGFVGRQMFALLPDGRIWVSKTHRFVAIERVNGDNRIGKTFIPFPTGGAFLEASNWVDWAGSLGQVAGIQSDGTLWKSAARTNSWMSSKNGTLAASEPKLERVGTDSNWTRVFAGYDFFLALKRDGTLWGWGNNNCGQLGPGTNRFQDDLVRIGNGRQWVTMFASRDTCIGLDRDGGLWKWGFLRNPPGGGDERGWKGAPHPEPVRWFSTETNLVAFVDGYQSDLAVRADGTLWGTGTSPWERLRFNPFGAAARDPGRQVFSRNKLVRVGSGTNWSEVAGSWDLLTALKKDGELLQSSPFTESSFWRKNTWKPSRCSDWIAAGRDDHHWTSATLAADGTVTFWPEPQSMPWSGEAPTFLRLSRFPLWSLNILAETK